jgi:hypothetical protein
VAVTHPNSLTYPFFSPLLGIEPRALLYHGAISSLHDLYFFIVLHMKNIMEVPQKTLKRKKTPKLPYNPEIPLLGYLQRS